MPFEKGQSGNPDVRFFRQVDSNASPCVDLLLEAEALLNESIYERFTSGEIGATELRDIYEAMHQWSRKTQELLRIVGLLK